MEGSDADPARLATTEGGDVTNPPAGGVLVPLSNGETPSRTLEVAAALAQSREAPLLALNVVPQARASNAVDHREAAERAVRAAVGTTAVSTTGLVRTGPDSDPVVTDAIAALDVSAVVLDGTSGSLSAAVRRSGVERVAAEEACDVVVVGGCDRDGPLACVLVPVAGGPHSGFAVDVALALARANDAWIELLHVTTPEREDSDTGRYVDAALDRLDGFDDVDTWLLKADDVAAAIVEQSEYYDVTVMGAPRAGRLRQLVFGSTPGAVRDDARNVVVTAKRNGERGGR